MTKYNREIRNYILITMGMAVIFLIFLFHLIAPLNSLLSGYNHLVDHVNASYNATYSHRKLSFFGEGLESISFLIDIIIVAVIIIIGLMVYLSIHWSVKQNKNNFE